MHNYNRTGRGTDHDEDRSMPPRAIRELGSHFYRGFFSGGIDHLKMHVPPTYLLIGDAGLVQVVHNP